MNTRQTAFEPLPASVLFVPDKPTSEGCYWMKCMENNQTPEWVAVYWLKTPKHGKLLVCDWDLGNRCPLKSVHDGLTEVTWAAALRVRTNVERTHRARKEGL